MPHFKSCLERESQKGWAGEIYFDIIWLHELLLGNFHNDNITLKCSSNGQGIPKAEKKYIDITW
jgi:hypothetical protein